MPYCPKCKTEYRDGFYICADCHIELVGKLPPDENVEHEEDDCFVPLIESYNPADIAFLKSLLDSANIEYYIDGENFLNVGPLAQPAIVMVLESDYEEASELLSDFKSRYTGVACSPKDKVPQKVEQDGRIAGISAGVKQDINVLNVVYAGFLARLTADIIDGLAVVGPNIILILAVNAGIISANKVWLGVIIAAICYIDAIIYGTYFIGSRGNTPGQKIMGIKTLSDDFKQVSYKQALYRTALYCVIYSIPVIGAVIAVASVMSFLNDEKKRMAHDKICKTIVVNVKTRCSLDQ